MDGFMLVLTLAWIMFGGYMYSRERRGRLTLELLVAQLIHDRQVCFDLLTPHYKKQALKLFRGTDDTKQLVVETVNDRA